MAERARIPGRLVREESGFTLLELLIVTITMGILLSIAAPAYLQFKDRSSKAAAAANLRQVEQSLAALRATAACYGSDRAAHGRPPMMPLIIDAVRRRATVGEIAGTVVDVWGKYQPR